MLLCSVSYAQDTHKADLWRDSSGVIVPRDTWKSVKIGVTLSGVQKKDTTNRVGGSYVSPTQFANDSSYRVLVEALKANSTAVLKNADSTTLRNQFLKNADSTTLRNQFLKNADSTTLRNQFLKNADSTTLRNQFPKNADTTTMRNYSNSLYQTVVPNLADTTKYAKTWSNGKVAGSVWYSDSMHSIIILDSQRKAWKLHVNTGGVLNVQHDTTSN